MLALHFKQLKTGGNFYYGGNLWRKRSSRTAEILQPERFAGRIFYFGQLDPIEIKTIK